MPEQIWRVHARATPQRIKVVSLRRRRLVIFALLFLQFLLFFNLGAAPPPLTQVEPPTPPPGEGTPTPPPPKEEESGGILTQIFQVVFSDETLAEALMNIFAEAAEDEAEQLQAQTAQWAEVLGEVLQAPEEGYYQAIAQSSLYTAAAMAVPLFLLRLALYHWHRLVGEEDSGVQVLGDWVAAGTLAVAAGPFLDMLASLSYWMAGAALGETSVLAQAFVESTSVFDVLSEIGQVSFFSPLFIIGTALGGVLAMTGMLFAFGAAQAVFFLMAVVAPSLAIASVIPQMRWMRALWLKAVALLALIPIIAGGIFKATVALAFLFSGSGLLTLLIRLLWLWGATGFMLSLAGILGRLTLTASVGTLGKLTQGVKAVVGTAVLAASIAGAGGAAAGASAIGATASSPGGLSGGGAATLGAGTTPARPSSLVTNTTPGDGGYSYSQQALGHLDAATEQTRQAGSWEVMGFRGAATFAQSQARQHEIAARTLELQQRLVRFAAGNPESTPPPNTGFGFSPSVNAEIQAAYPGTPDQFQSGFDRLSTHLQNAGLDPQVVAETYPQDTARMVSVFTGPHASGAGNPTLREIAEQGGANQFLQEILGEQKTGQGSGAEKGSIT